MKLKLNKKKIFLTLGMFIFSSSILVGAIVVKNEIIKRNSLVELADNEYLTVYIDGAVKYPGEYTFKDGAIYLDLIKEAVLESGANLKEFNKKQKLKNGEKITIPYSKNTKITVKDINGYEALVNLGIKRNIAIKVFDYISNNEIKKWDEILKIPGIGEKTYLILVENVDI